MSMGYLQDIMRCYSVTANEKERSRITAMKQQLRRMINFFFPGDNYVARYHDE
jgi:hypothetical protein